MNILIIEDERLAVEKIMQVLRKVRPQAHIMGVLDSIAAVITWFSEQNQQPDLILMDIELADGQSFAIFEQIPIISPVIFVTSYDEYALKAFKVNSIDYLLKPIQQDELRLALEKFDRTKSFYQDTNTQKHGILDLISELQRNTVSQLPKAVFSKAPPKTDPHRGTADLLFLLRGSCDFL